MGEYDLLIGPTMIGTAICLVLVGVILMQMHTYWTMGYQDSWWIKAMTIWLVCLDLTHTIGSVWMVWQQTVTHYGEPAFLEIGLWPLNSSPGFTVGASCAVQLFLGWRIRILTGNNLIYGLIVVLSILSFLAGLGTTIGIWILSNLKTFGALSPIANTWFSLQVADDVIITSVLVWTLSRNKTGFRSTDGLIDAIIKGAVQTAAFATADTILLLAMFASFPTLPIYMIFALPGGRIYTMTFLGTLNARARLRERSQPSTMRHTANNNTTWLGDIRFKPATSAATGVNVTIERDVELLDYGTATQQSQQSQTFETGYHPEGGPSLPSVGKSQDVYADQWSVTDRKAVL